MSSALESDLIDRINVDELLGLKQRIKLYVEETLVSLGTFEEITNIWDEESLIKLIGDSLVYLNIEKNKENTLNFLTQIMISLLSVSSGTETIYDKIKKNSSFTLYSHSTGGGFIEICFLSIVKKLNSTINLTFLCCEFVKSFNIIVKNRLLKLGIFDDSSIVNYCMDSLPFVNNNNLIDLIIMIHSNYLSSLNLNIEFISSVLIKVPLIIDNLNITFDLRKLPLFTLLNKNETFEIKNMSLINYLRNFSNLFLPMFYIKRTSLGESIVFENKSCLITLLNNLVIFGNNNIIFNNVVNNFIGNINKNYHKILFNRDEFIITESKSYLINLTNNCLLNQVCKYPLIFDHSNEYEFFKLINQGKTEFLFRLITSLEIGLENFKSYNSFNPDSFYSKSKFDIFNTVLNFNNRIFIDKIFNTFYINKIGCLYKKQPELQLQFNQTSPDYNQKIMKNNFNKFICDSYEKKYIKYKKKYLKLKKQYNN